MIFELLCLFLFVSKEYVKAQCSYTTESGDGSCVCHCALASSCNTYGGCAPPYKCSVGWSGANCQRENVALNQPTYQSSTSDFYISSRAVDGDIKTSARTKTGKNQFLNVKLKRVIRVKWIKVELLSADTFNVLVHDFIANKTTLCVQKRIESSTPIVECPVPRKGSLLQLGLENRGSIALSEVSVYSCSAGTYGQYCNGICSFGCIDICNEVTGECSCKYGYHGYRCTNKCPNGCQYNNCSSTDGTCGQCKPGYGGSRCDTCIDGFYGDNCEACTDVGNCMDGLCDLYNGYCTSGCESGWFGNYCHKSCPVNCIRCDRNTGNCMECNGKFSGNYCSECVLGYFGSLCDTQCYRGCNKMLGCAKSNGQCSACNEGRHGQFCDANCSVNCADETRCEQNGDCIGGCKPGFRGSDCDSKCSIENCVKCSPGTDLKCENCISGWFPKDDTCIKCPSGCVDCLNEAQCTSCDTGLAGNTCSEICNANCTGNKCLPSGFCKYECTNQGFGLGCSQRCRENCLKCYNGNNCTQCSDRYFGLYCTGKCNPNCQKCSEKAKCDVCDDGFFGTSCDERCPDNCVSCHHLDGRCVQCKSGYYGIRCDLNCSQSCTNLACSIDKGTCTFGCRDGFSGDTCVKSVVLGPSSGWGLTITVAVAGCVVVVIFLVIILFCRRRLNKKTAANKKGRDMEVKYENQTDIQYNHSQYANVEDTARSATDMNVYAVVTHTSPYALRGSVAFLVEIDHNEMDSNEKVDGNEIVQYGNVNFNKMKVGQLWETVREKKVEHKLSEEFEEIPKGLLEPYEEAIKTTNKSRNRYKKIYPYDFNRVILRAETSLGSTDYINASFIDGYDKDKTYIAAQGPFTTETILDFWRMIWQMKAEKIVMLTNLVEGNVMKCKQYWPDDCDHYGGIRVNKANEEQYTNYTVRHFNVMMNGQERRVAQFHFTTWPDKNVPKSVNSLVNFRNKVVGSECNNTGPTVVHCSAGIGRTGTYIALDILMKEGEEENAVDVSTCLYKLRQQRTNAVQTVEQYIYLHDALVQGLTADSEHVAVADFNSYYKRLLSKNQMTNKSYLQEQYELLNQSSPSFDSSHFKTALQPENRWKNRYQNIPAADSYRVFLSERPGQSNYINAIVLPGYKERNEFILTQMPTDRTLEDFWHMVFQQDISTIVMMNGIKKYDKDGGVYWPSDGTSQEIGVFVIEQMNKESPSPAFDAVTLKVTTNTGEYEEKIVKQFRCKCWPEDALIPHETLPLLQFLTSVNTWKSQINNPLTIVHCRNGAKKSGLFCTLSVIIERLISEEEIGIFQIALQMRKRRPQILQNKDQLEFCYEAVQTYLSDFRISAICK